MTFFDIFAYSETHLIDLCSARGDHPVWNDIHRGDAYQITWRFALSREAWSDLPPWEQFRLRAVAHSLSNRKTILMGKAAAALHGIPIMNPSEVEVCLPNGSVPPRSTWSLLRYRRRRLRPDMIVELHGHRVTSLARTATDIALMYGFAEGLIAYDAVLGRGVTRSELRALLAQLGRSHGIATARRCVDLASNLSQSPGESLARALLLDAKDLPIESLEPQFKIGKFYADLCINGWLIIEIDGNIKYVDDPARAIRAEREREKFIANQGFVILRYSPNDLRDAPQRLLDDVSRALRTHARKAA